jgi:GNAT superfamily N-acetyltransferase
MVGVQAFRVGEVISSRHPLAIAWQERGGGAELRRLRVAPEARGQSLGTRLCQTVINWSRERFSTLVVNTTTPQEPALQLYRKLGFQEAGISFIDRYELVWLELVL